MDVLRMYLGGVPYGVLDTAAGGCLPRMCPVLDPKIGKQCGGLCCVAHGLGDVRLGLGHSTLMFVCAGPEQRRTTLPPI